MSVLTGNTSDTLNGDEGNIPMATPTSNVDQRHTDAPTTGSQIAGFWDLFLRHWHETIVCCAAFWSFGMCVAFLGPTLLDLGCQTGSTMSDISWVFLVQMLCGLIGSIFAGILVKRMDSYEVLVVSTALIPLFMVVIPFCPTLWSLVLALGAMGLYMGAVDCLATLNIIQIFEERVAPFLQLMFFCYGIGAFVSPMITEPFLLNEDCSAAMIEVTTVSFSNILFRNDSDVTEADFLHKARLSSGVSVAFWTMAAMQTPVPFIVLSLVLKRRRDGWTRAHRKLINSHSTDACAPAGPKDSYYDIDKRTGGQKDGPPFSVASDDCCLPEVFYVTLMASSLLFVTEGLQSSFGGYINSYAVQSIPQLPKPEGAYVDACFWGTFALGRLLSVFIATRYHPTHMLLVSLVGTLVSTMFLLGVPHARVSLYIGTCLFGLFLSSTSPTIISLTEQYVDLTMPATTVLVVIAAFGEMFCPVVVGNMFVNIGPDSLLVYGCVMCAIGLAVFVVLSMYGPKTRKQKERGAINFWCSGHCFRGRPTEERLISTKWTPKAYNGDDSSNIQMRHLALTPDTQRDS